MKNGTMSQAVRVDANSTVRHLVELAVRGLPPMFDPQRQLFCYTLKKTSSGLVQEGISPRYTAITLMGLHRLERAGTASPIALAPVLQALMANTDWVDNIGDLGLLLWACALVAPQRLEELERRFEIGAALTRYADAKESRTMEMAWFLAGLCHWGLALPEMRSKLRDQAYETFRRLARNQGQRVFAHLATSKSIKGMFRGKIGSFADQVYPIYAMSKFFEAYGEPEALQRALDCGRAICEAQGPLGQWWWHYEFETGRVFEGYPVFSVHQHGMAPDDAACVERSQPGGLQPLDRQGTAVDQWPQRAFLRHGRRFRQRNLALHSAAHVAPGTPMRCCAGPATARCRQAPEHLQVLFECRPYELGWLLYAYAGSTA